ncbi:hypothetical protein P153DRAFT_420568 [Dothidotthia symphoricarpi CBS 119687]|uniref:SMP domain-containing protein n=1 Tax=Dothidotthia symphoricarpi CBS 119687 TaxID=1392245 RepID=A0A6A6AN77_9PLEO|nr:uncharacterized protein P153DRAFT_420568 [Dothidotthia symphoricarpi CBS 119687]KAF2132598.1 hypothetical protein P153DRAFT_420568 [Dothidotthia symphoricarpi CBS 119687]
MRYNPLSYFFTRSQTNDDNMSDASGEQKLVDNTPDQEHSTPNEQEQPSEAKLEREMIVILHKLKNDPGSITTEDARRLSENTEAKDERSARIISAVESLAVANVEVHEKNPELGQVPHTSLLTVVRDLDAAVARSPEDVTPDVLRGAQSIVSKMQRAVGQHTAPQPELEPQLREAYARIEPKIEQGTVTKAEADHLHSLEARAHGHTEKGGLTAIAQSVVAKRERQLSLSSGSTNGRSRASSKSLTPQEQSRHDKETSLHKTEAAVKPKIEHGTVTQADTDVLRSQSLASTKRQQTLSDQSNASRVSQEEYERRKEHGKDFNSKMAELVMEPKAHKRENSQVAIETN